MGAYYDDVKNAVLEHLKDEPERYIHYSGSDLLDEFINADSVTGNASGSFFCNSEVAKEMVLENISEVAQVYYEYYDMEELGMDIYNAAWENIDVKARCGVLSRVIQDVLSELEEERAIDDDDEEVDDDAE